MAGVALRDRYTGGVLVVDKDKSAALLGGRRYKLADEPKPKVEPKPKAEPTRKQSAPRGRRRKKD